MGEKKLNALKSEIRARSQNGSCCLQFISDRQRQTRETQRAKALKANMCTSTKAKARCSQKEKELFKATQHGNIFKAAVSHCCMQLYLGLLAQKDRKDRG